MSNYKLVIERSIDNQFVVTLRSTKNGQTVFTSETYKRKQSAIKIAEKIASETSPSWKIEDKTNAKKSS